MNMKKFFILAVMATIVAFMASCSAEDPFEEYYSNNGWNNDGFTPGSSSSSTTTGELATFDVDLNTEGTEPTESTETYYPDEEDILEDKRALRYEPEYYQDMTKMKESVITRLNILACQEKILKIVIMHISRRIPVPNGYMLFRQKK